MGQQCAILGTKPVTGMQYSHRGKAKYLGGVGVKVTGKSKRRFKPNLQRVKALVDGEVRYIRVTASALKQGLVTKAPKRKWKKEVVKAKA